MRVLVWPVRLVCLVGGSGGLPTCEDRIMQPMLATPTGQVPTGASWVHEVKWDGMRILADVHDGSLRLSARSGADATVRFPELAGLADVHPDVLLDGEVVSMHGGRPSFSRLVERIHARDAATARRLASENPVTYMCFDVMRLDGHDLCALPWRDRRSLLEALDLPARALVTPVYPDGEALLEATALQGLEGVVSKRAASRYEPGQRSPHWRKLAHRPTTSVVVGGWRPESTSGMGVGALLVGLPSADGLRFVGRVGSGLGAAAERRLLPLLEAAQVPQSPFDAPLPPADLAGSRWVRPELVIDVRSLGEVGHSQDGRLRQPVFTGLRTDLSRTDLTELTEGSVIPETPVSPETQASPAPADEPTQGGDDG